MNAILYGALASPPGVLGVAQRLKLQLKRSLHHRIDMRNLRAGDASSLDYRNYGRDTSTNIGDQAISDVIALTFSELCPGVRLEHVNWGAEGAIQRSRTAQEGGWLLVAGGGYVFFSVNGRLSPRILADLTLCERYGLRLALIGVGINQQTANLSDVGVHADDAATLRKLLDMASFVSVRDAFTQQVLQGFTDKEVLLMGDPALHLASRLSVSPPQPAVIRRSRPHIGINLPFHGPTSTRLLAQNLSHYADALKALRKQTNCQFFYFQHYDTESTIPLFLKRLGVEVTPVRPDMHTMLKAYADLDLHIGGMLHSCIFAHSVDTPCIGLAYDVKHQGFFSLFGMEPYCLSAFEFQPEQLIQQALHALEHRTQLRQQIRETRESLQSVAGTFFADLTTQLRAPLP